jgi:galactokinase
VLDPALEAMWREHFPGDPEVFSSGPGRVNLIGEHTDYNEGFVFPAAIDRRTDALLRRTTGPTNIVSKEAGQITGFMPGELIKSRNWGRYVSSCALRLRDVTGDLPPSLEGVVASTVPSGSGLSSSAALDLCFLTAWNFLAGSPLSPFQVAIIAAEADNMYVGVQSGVMDQMASALGDRDAALFIDTRSRDYSLHNLPDGVAIAVLDTRRPRSLAASAYNERVMECKRAVESIAEVDPSVRSLRDATLDHLSAADLDEIARKRARHVITENGRTLAFRKALDEGDVRSLGVLARESHESLRHDYEVSCPELDAMARAAWNAPGCIAARMTGAGFGGCCVALVASDSLDRFLQSVSASYGMYGYREPRLFQVRADLGAFARAF